MKILNALICGALFIGGCSKPAETPELENPPSNGLEIVPLAAANMGTTAPRQNAQTIAAVAVAARAAGYTRVWRTKEDAVVEIVQGISLPVGGQDVEFSAKGMGLPEQRDAMAYLIFDSAPPGSLRYTNDVQP